MSQDFVRYGYALVGETHQLVGIDSLNRMECANNKYFCPHCQKEMYPTFGDVQTHHFRHKGTQCEYNGYLHKLAILAFYDEYNSCLQNEMPFILELHPHLTCNIDCIRQKGSVCELYYNIFEVDLTRIYKHISIESKVDVDDHYRRPDILLWSDSGEQLWVEVWVKHETEFNKRNDGQIVEIRIKSEVDIEQIKQHRIIHKEDKGATVRIFNVVFDDQNPAVNKKPSPIPHQCNLYRRRQYNVPNKSVIVRKPQIPKPVKTITTQTPPPPVFSESDIDWIDLDLPSGTLWASVSEEFRLPFGSAFDLCGKFLPSKEQAEELYEYCQRDWDNESKELIMTGRNGNSIRFTLKNENESFWLNKYETRDQEFAQRIHLGSDKHFNINDDYSYKPSRVHLCWAFN